MCVDSLYGRSVGQPKQILEMLFGNQKNGLLKMKNVVLGLGCSCY